MKQLTMVILILSAAYSGWSQNLDMTQTEIMLSCDEHHYGSEKGYTVQTPAHVEKKVEEQNDSVTITINSKDRTIAIFDVTKNRMLHELKYMSHAQSSNKNDAGQAFTETMFLVRNKEILMITHDNKKHVMNVIFNNNTLQLFKNLKLVVQE